ncbi:zf-HC2 domain-containing protein [Marinobacter salinexigens]|uniref:Zf-HC2 domain-containing protein n=1 Tax=Marinobacter salinexigens TaxID=2919747 RepID=A0A5B0VK89_9GAMM|nr:zf-HC2 domain-containing protein [Marinobacter salinexigens]KAA1174339.1 zf-HC2 domain-containing protein [Marinobacter salinexigens]
MNCNEFKQCLDAFVGDELPEVLATRMREHAGTCAACSVDLEAARFVAERIASGHAPEPEAGFEARMFRGIRNGNPAGSVASGSIPRSGRSMATPLWGGAVAAALVLGLFIGSEVGREPEAPSQTADAPVQEPQLQTRQQVVRLAFTASQALENVTLTLELPANMELAPFPGHQTVSWKVNLQPGDNLLALPLNILFPGEGTLVAHLGEGNNRKTFRTEIREQKTEPSS